MANIRQAFEYAAKNPNSDFAKNLAQLASSGALNVEAKANNIDLTPFQPQPVEQPKPKETIPEKITNFIGGKQLAQGLGQALANPEIAKQQDKIMMDNITQQSELLKKKKEIQDLGGDITHIDKALEYNKQNRENLAKDAETLYNQKGLTPKEVIGSSIQLAANALPGAGKGLSLPAKVGVGAATGYAYDVGSKLQNKDKTVGEAFIPGAGTIIGGSLPVVGALVKNLIIKPLSGIVKGLGSGLSGVGAQSINDIIKNPKMAQEVSNALKKEGNSKILQNQSQIIMNGVSKIKSEASSAYSKGLDSLSKVDINPTIIKDEIKSVVSSNGGNITSKGFNLKNVEFAGDPKLTKKASDLINKINTQKDLTGRGIRQVMEDIEKSKLKTATTDISISFNKFMDELSNGLKTSIGKSTNKLDTINAKYSQDISLSDAIQSIFSNVKFKNLEELNSISQKIEGLANQKGLSPQIVDDFFARIKKSLQDFKTTEAVRQISNKVTSANTKGLTIGEITQQITSGIITPNLVKNIAIFTGKTQPVIKKILENGTPAAKKLLFNTIASLQKK